MQTFTQKYTIVQLLEDMPEGAQFPSSSWPLHATIVGTFAIDWDVPTMIGKLTDLLSHHALAESVAMDDAWLGPTKQTRVTVLQRTNSLIKLHYDVIELIQQGGLVLNTPQYVREGFLPHATVQKHAGLKKGDVITFNALTLIDMFPDQDPHQRRVLKTIPIRELS